MLAGLEPCEAPEGGRLTLTVGRSAFGSVEGTRSRVAVESAGVLCTSSSGLACPIPAAAACVESVRVTVSILLFAVDCGREAFGACSVIPSAIFLVCSGVSRAVLAALVTPGTSGGRRSYVAYSEPSWPIEGRAATLGGRGGTSSVARVLGLLVLGGAWGSWLRGERTSRIGEGSSLREGRGGTTGVDIVSLCAVVESINEDDPFD